MVLEFLSINKIDFVICHCLLYHMSSFELSKGDKNILVDEIMCLIFKDRTKIFNELITTELDSAKQKPNSFVSVSNDIEKNIDEIINLLSVNNEHFKMIEQNKFFNLESERNLWESIQCAVDNIQFQIK